MLQATLEPGKNELRGGSNDRFRVHENNSCFLLPRLLLHARLSRKHGRVPDRGERVGHLEGEGGQGEGQA